jgi:hypothetical protein
VTAPEPPPGTKSGPSRDQEPTPADVERARELLPPSNWPGDEWKNRRAAIAAALAEVRREERERCAKIAEEIARTAEVASEHVTECAIAAAIRGGADAQP